ncbi:Coiled-coil domain-containing protein 39 [Geranomyces variabilis]|uniref:Coiled-coil domain-containing protein 39 n=1 Tax=Geranomyces variabilis TaxID=109894 RepID=A0AAD5TIR7_9FUNG|nr:Coiled-coil domain-containing protein 39 [Geranomyces variabilis]
MLSGDDNFHAHSLPPFANAQNKALSKEIIDAEAKLSLLLSSFEDNAARTETMSAHMKNVQQELQHTQALSDAKGRQIDTEDHFKQLAEREAGRLVLEIKAIDKEILEATEHLSTIQNNIYRGNERIDGIRADLKLEKSELDEWLRVQSEKEEDNMALLKYTKEDDQKIKELSLGIEKLMQEVNKKKAILSAEVTETQVTQIELDKTTEAFKQLHQERQELIQQWEQTIEGMRKKDLEIVDVQAAFEKTKDEIKDQQRVIDDKQRFLDQQNETNAETEKTIGLTERAVSKYRFDQNQANASLIQFQDELEVLRNTLNKTATDLVNKRGEVVNLKDDLHDKTEKLAREKQHTEDMKTRLAMITNKTMTMEQKAQELAEILKQEEMRSKELDRELKVLREQQFKRNQEVFRLKQDEKDKGAEITGGEAALRNLKSKVHRLDQEALKQQAMLYAQEFQIQQLERKLRRAQGERTDEEKEMLMKRIEDLNQQLESSTAKWGLLNAQLKKSQGDVVASHRKLEILQKDKTAVKSSIDELTLHNDSASKQLNQKIQEKENLMVEENILRLELRKLRGFLNARADEVFSLETRQVHLQLALEERTKEIEIHKDMLRLQLKSAEEERYSASAELRDRVSKVERLKRRYEIVMTNFSGTHDGDEEGGAEEHSQAYYVIRAAQHREELQREGDELDAQIRKAEKEIKALENTLKMMNDRNEEYRMNLYKAELSSKDVQHREMLEQQYRHAMERYKSKRAEIQDLQSDLMSSEKHLLTLTSAESSRLQTVSALEAKLASLHRDIAGQEARLQRAQKTVGRAAKDLRKVRGGSATDDAGEEADFKVRQLKETGNIALEHLTKVAEKSPELAARVGELLLENGVQPPSRVVSRVQSRSESRASLFSETGSDGGSSTTSSAGAGGGRRSSGGVRMQSPRASLAMRPTGVQLSGRATPTRLSTTNLNASVTLPTVEATAPGRGSPAGSGPITPGTRTPITGAGRIRGPARPGSASSASSHGNAGGSGPASRRSSAANSVSGGR